MGGAVWGLAVTFAPGPRSRLNLVGVHADLVRCVNYAYTVTEVDFSVLEGRRSATREKALFEAGASHTLQSRHITGHAVDIAPYLQGRIHWEWPLFYPVIESFWLASHDLGIPLRWGGVWDRALTELDRAHLDDEFHAYTARAKAAGQNPLSDGGHIELPRSAYP